MINYDRFEVDTMKYMHPDLRSEYERYTREYHDLDAFTPPMLNVSDVLRAYFTLVDFFSDPTADGEQETMLVGIRDMNLLISALGRQNAGYMGRMKYTKPIDICATLFFGLVKNHAFSDGNKRTALLSLLYQLDAYGFRPSVSQKEFENLVVSVAGNLLATNYPKEWKHISQKNRLDNADHCVAVISQLLTRMTRKKDNTFHLSVTARDLKHAFDNLPDCTCAVDGIKIKVQRTIKRRVWIFKQSDVVKTFTIPYRGETRAIGAATIRDALEALEIYDQYPDYQSFFAGADPRYVLISQFEGPLRRLKDK